MLVKVATGEKLMRSIRRFFSKEILSYDGNTAHGAISVRCSRWLPFASRQYIFLSANPFAPRALTFDDPQTMFHSLDSVYHGIKLVVCNIVLIEFAFYKESLVIPHGKIFMVFSLTLHHNDRYPRWYQAYAYVKLRNILLIGLPIG